MNTEVYRKLRLVYQKPEIKASTEVILSVFASLFLVLMAIRPTLVTVAELKKKIEDQTLVETKLDTKIKKLIQARRQLDENEDLLPLLERTVPEGYTYANLAKKIEIVAVETGVEIESLVFSSVVVSSDDESTDKKDSGQGRMTKNREWVNGKSTVKEFTVHFSVVADELYVVDFLKKIENLDRVLTISTIDITKVREREGLVGKLRASGEINGYYLVDSL